MTKTKLVVRHLPPDMTEDAFRATIDDFKDEFTWSYFHQGKARARVEWSQLGVAYLNLKDPNRVHAFSSKMVGRLFQDADGKDYACEVEYAPQQRIPRNRRQKDARQNTIAQDEGFLEFCENLKKDPVALPSAEKQLEAREAEKKEKEEISIPIIEFVLKSTKIGSRSRTAYNNGGGGGSSSSSHRNSESSSRGSSSKQQSSSSSTTDSRGGSGKALTRIRQTKKWSEDKRRQKERKTVSSRSTTSSSSSSTSASLSSPKKEKHGGRRGDGPRGISREGDDKDSSRRNRNKRRTDEKPAASTPVASTISSLARKTS